MAITITAGAWDGSAAGASVDPGLPASPQAGDLHVLYAGAKSFATVFTTPDGWTLITNTDGTNGIVAAGTDVGSIVQAAYYRYWVSGDTANPSVVFTAGDVGGGVVIRFRPTAGSTIDTPVGDKGSDVSSGTDYAATMGSDIGITVGDAVAAFTSIAGNNSSFGTPTLSAAGVTFGTVTENPATEFATSSGTDFGASAATALPSAGPSSAAAVVGWTLGVAQTGMTALVRIRETTSGSSVNKSESITVSESHSESVGTSQVAPSDTVSVAESVARLITSFVSQSDSVAVAESVAVEVVNVVEKSEAITVAESVALLIDTSLVNVGDSVTVTEASTAVVEVLINKSESIAVAENQVVEIVTAINVTDSVAVAESKTAVVEVLINTSDAVAVAESQSETVGTSQINVSDAVSVAESATVNLPIAGETNVNVSESITVGESVVLVVGTAQINVSDNISLAEALFAEVSLAGINVSDNIILTESSILAVSTSQIGVSDAVSLAENWLLLITSGLPIFARNTTITAVFRDKRILLNRDKRITRTARDKRID